MNVLSGVLQQQFEPWRWTERCGPDSVCIPTSAEVIILTNQGVLINMITN